MKRSFPRILFHVRGNLTEDETAFYSKFNSKIEEFGGSLFLVGHHCPQSPDLPFFRVPSGPHRVQLSPIHDSFGVNESEALESLKNVAHLWHGSLSNKEEKESSERALSFFQGYYKLLLDYIQPSLVIIWNGYHPQEKILADLARSRDCRISYVERGQIPGTIHYDSQGVLAASSFATQADWCWENKTASESWGNLFDKIKFSLMENLKHGGSNQENGNKVKYLNY